MMKPSIHPEYRTVVFHDIGTDEYFRIDSIIKTDREVESNDATYPYVATDASLKSYPFYTRKLRIVASEGDATRLTQHFGRLVGAKRGT